MNPGILWTGTIEWVAVRRGTDWIHSFKNIFNKLILFDPKTHAPIKNENEIATYQNYSG